MNYTRTLTQFKREFWENHGSFVLFPLAIAAFYVAIMIVGYLLLEVVEVDFTLQISEASEENTVTGESVPLIVYVEERLGYIASLPMAERQERVTMVLYALAIPFVFSVLFVSFFYLLDSLHSERKDRSILFWKSLPVSDTETVLVKLVTGAMLVPLLFLLAAMVMQVFAMLVLSAMAIAGGYSALAVVWEPALLGKMWGSALLGVLTQILWSAPLYGWLLLVSAWFRASLFLWALGVPLVLYVLERLFLGESLVGGWFGRHALPMTLPHGGAESLATRLLSLEAAAGVVIGAAMIAAAIFLRSRADEI